MTETDPRLLPPDRFRHATAVHEAGHATAAFYSGRDIVSVDIREVDGEYGRVIHKQTLAKLDLGIDEEAARDLEDVIVLRLAGPLAEKEWLRRHVGEALDHIVDEYADGDYKAAADLASYLHWDDEELDRYLDTLVERAGTLVSSEPFQRAVETLAAVLLSKVTLTGEQAFAIIKEALDGPTPSGPRP